VKKVLIIGLTLAIMLICCGEVLAAPTIDFKGSEIRISGEYLPERYWTSSLCWSDLWEWGIGGTIRLNVRGKFVVYFASVEAELLSFTEMGESVLEWYPILQDYYWKVTVGVEISKLSFEVYFNQYCLHAIDRYVPEIKNEYNGLGCSLTLKL
jgi:hypothetical protein